MTANFTPTIEQYRTGFWLTAPRPIREKVWEVLFGLQDNVITIEGGAPTEICVNSNPGHAHDEALTILIVATHIAISGEFDDLYSIGRLENHIDKIKSEMDIKIQGTVYHEGKIMFWIGSWIIDSATKKLKDKASSITGLNENWAKAQEIEVLKIRNQIRDQLSWLTSPLLKLERLNQCDQTLSALAITHNLIKRINENVQILKENAQEQIAIYLKGLQNADVVLGTYSNWRDSRELLDRMIKEAENYRNQLQEDNLIEAIKFCKTLVR